MPITISNANAEYQALLAEIDALRTEKWSAMEVASEQWKAMCLLECNRRQPKVRNPHKYEKLEKEFTMAKRLEEPWVSILAADKAASLKLTTMRDRLYDLAAKVVPIHLDHVFNQAETSSSTNYRSQGWGAAEYARGSLLPFQDKLTALGYTTHLSGYVRRFPSSTPGREPCSYTDYVLWANGEPYAMDAHSKSITIQEAADCLAAKNLHPQVVMPMAYNHPAVSEPNWGGRRSTPDTAATGVTT